jgi:hypothetical protein
VARDAAQLAIESLSRSGERAWLAGELVAGQGEPRVEVAGD